MRGMIAIFILTAGPAFGFEDFSTKSGCMNALAKEARNADVWARLPEYRGQDLQAAPDGNDALIDDIIESYKAIANAQRRVADGLLKLCSQYPD